METLPAVVCGHRRTSGARAAGQATPSLLSLVAGASDERALGCDPSGRAGRASRVSGQATSTRHDPTFALDPRFRGARWQAPLAKPNNQR